MAAQRQQDCGGGIGNLLGYRWAWALAWSLAAALACLWGCETAPRTNWRAAGDGGPVVTTDVSEGGGLIPPSPALDLTIAVVGDPGSMRLVESSAPAARLMTMGSVFEPLIEYDPVLERYQPRLATNWASSEAGQQWTLSLRDATFHDGAPLSAADVKYSLDHARTVAPQYRGQLATLRAVEVVDEHTVRLSLAAPDGYILRALGEVPIVPAHIYARRGGVPLPIGTGPYLATARTAQTLELRRYDGYWGAKARVGSLRFMFSRDVSLVGAWTARPDTDMVIAAPSALADPIAARGMAWVALAPRVRYIILRADRPPLDDPRVRRALSALIDRALVVVARRSEAPTSTLAWLGGPIDALFVPSTPDATALLEEVGWIDSNRDGLRDKDGQVLKVTFMFVDRGATERHRHPEELSPVIEAWKAAGIGVDMVFAPASVVQSRLASGSFSVAALEMELWRDIDLSPYLGSGGNENYGRFSSPQSDTLLRALRATQLPSARKIAAAALAAELDQQMPIIPLASSSVRMAVAPYVDGVVPRGTWVDFGQIARRPIQLWP